MLTGAGSYSESKENTVTFPEISTPILEKVLPSRPFCFYERLREEDVYHCAICSSRALLLHVTYSPR